MGSRGFHLWLRMLAPASLPHIVSGTKQGWAFAWRSLMAEEIYITILSGLGIRPACRDVRTIGAGKFAGHEVAIITIWKVDRNRSLKFGYSHFYGGDYLRDAGPHSDADFGYVQATITF